jgi:hypothetical protein
LAGPAFAQDPPVDTRPVEERADAQAEAISGDTGKYLAELDRAIRLAKEGQYGKLPKGATERLTTLRMTIGDLLAGGVDPRTLSPDQRLALFNSHQEIEAILKKNDKSRMVCTREAEIGSRVTKTSCMTVGEREERARLAQRGTDSMQRNVCTPGPGNACSK